MLLPTLRLTQKPVLTDAVSLFPWDEMLARRFSLMTRFNEPYCMFGRRGDFIELPRAVAPVSENDKRDPGIAIDCNLVVPPKNAEQKRLAGEMAALLQNGESFILCAGTGTGKTWLGAAAVATVKRKTLVIVPKQDLMDQWRERMKTFLGLKDHEIGIIQADNVSVIGKKVVLGMIHSVALQNRYPKGTFDQFGLVIFDECHRAPADTLSLCFRNLPAQLRMGLSTTPKRADGKEQLLYAHIGPIRVESHAVLLTPKVLAFRSAWKVPHVRRRDPDTGAVSFGPIPHSAAGQVADGALLGSGLHLQLELVPPCQAVLVRRNIARKLGDQRLLAGFPILDGLLRGPVGGLVAPQRVDVVAHVSGNVVGFSPDLDSHSTLLGL